LEYVQNKATSRYGLAIFAAGAVISPTALAGEWMVEGKPLVGSEELAESAAVLTSGELVVLPAVTTIKCKGREVGITEGKILAPDGILAKAITFTECEGEGACTGLLNEGHIKTVPVHGLALLEGPLHTYISVLPQTKTVLTTIGFTNENCALFPSQPVTGSASLLVHEGFDERKIHVVLAFSLPKALKVGSSEADLRNVAVDLELKSKKAWSFL
jgi:hypothetical protein